ncbi:MAG: flavodoxin domain-containing protein [Candidatus Bathyarchaeota archaeon]|jgi:flavorubredoxin|nr:flavodoxin domain-containing protein [Candidatus Bathyarchaeota archaeon]
MKKVIIIYFSRTGNTKTMAQLIHEELVKSSEIQVDIQTQIVPDELTQYDAILIGAPTYHHRMTQTISTLLEDAAIKEVKLEGKLGAAFGSFGWSGEAPRLVLEVMENIFQMNVIKPPLLIKYVPRGDGPAKCQEFGARVIQELQKL